MYVLYDMFLNLCRGTHFPVHCWTVTKCYTSRYLRLRFQQLQLIIDDQRVERATFEEAVDWDIIVHVHIDCKPSMYIIFAIAAP